MNGWTKQMMKNIYKNTNRIDAENSAQNVSEKKSNRKTDLNKKLKLFVWGKTSGNYSNIRVEILWEKQN